MPRLFHQRYVKQGWLDYIIVQSVFLCSPILILCNLTDFCFDFMIPQWSHEDNKGRGKSVTLCVNPLFYIWQEFTQLKYGELCFDWVDWILDVWLQQFLRGLVVFGDGAQWQIFPRGPKSLAAFLPPSQMGCGDLRKKQPGKNQTLELFR